MDAHPHAQHPPSTPPTRLDIQDPGDCLALVKHTFGGLPRDSLVVIGLLDGCTGGHMRIDLRPALREPFSSARLIAECLAGEGSAPAPEAALILLIGDESAPVTQDQPWLSCLAALRIMLESEYCVRIVQAWFVSAGHVRDPLCTLAGCCIFPGRSIEDLRIPALGAFPDGSSLRETTPLDQAAAGFLERAPEADPALTAALQLLRSEDPEPPTTQMLGRRLQAWDLALREQAESGEHASQSAPASRGGMGARATAEPRMRAVRPGDPRMRAERLAELLAQLRTGFERDLLIPLAALGFEHAMAGLRHQRGLAEVPPDRVGEQLLQDYASCFLGETAHRPDWDRIDALESVLCTLVPYVRGAERENLLCLMMWIEWARGRGTAAGSFIDRCLQEFPDNEFSRLIERLMELKGVCRWARVKERSWSWSRSSPAIADRR